MNNKLKGVPGPKNVVVRDVLFGAYVGEEITPSIKVLATVQCVGMDQLAAIVYDYIKEMEDENTGQKWVMLRVTPSGDMDYELFQGAQWEPTVLGLRDGSSSRG